MSTLLQKMVTLKEVVQLSIDIEILKELNIICIHEFSIALDEWKIKTIKMID